MPAVRRLERKQSRDVRCAGTATEGRSLTGIRPAKSVVDSGAPSCKRLPSAASLNPLISGSSKTSCSWEVHFFPGQESNQPLSQDGREFVGQGCRWETWSRQFEASDLLAQLFGPLASVCRVHRRLLVDAFRLCLLWHMGATGRCTTQRTNARALGCIFFWDPSAAKSTLKTPASNDCQSSPLGSEEPNAKSKNVSQPLKAAARLVSSKAMTSHFDQHRGGQKYSRNVHKLRKIPGPQTCFGQTQACTSVHRLGL